MLIFQDDEEVCGYPGEVHLYLDIKDGKIIIHSAQSNYCWGDGWYSNLFFSEEESQKVFSLLNARDEEEMGIILKERFFPKEPAPETERPVLNDLSRFLNAILDFLKANDIHWVEGYKTWYEDIQKETISTRYH